MKYFFRYIKIVEISDKKNYPFSSLLKSNDDGGYSILSNSNDYPNSSIIYKYQDKYIETSNVIEIDSIDFEEMSKRRGTFYSGCEIYEHRECGGMRIYYKSDSPNPFDYFDYRTNNRYDIMLAIVGVYSVKLGYGIGSESSFVFTPELTKISGLNSTFFSPI